MERFLILIPIVLKFMIKGPIDNKSGANPLDEPVIT